MPTRAIELRMRLCRVCRGPETRASSKSPWLLLTDGVTGQNFDNFWPDGRGKKSRTHWV